MKSCVSLFHSISLIKSVVCAEIRPLSFVFHPFLSSSSVLRSSFYRCFTLCVIKNRQTDRRVIHCIFRHSQI